MTNAPGVNQTTTVEKRVIDLDEGEPLSPWETLRRQFKFQKYARVQFQFGDV